jgi:hypothetical protein
MATAKDDFDYTAQEWTRIHSAVARVRSERLSEVERDALLITAFDYLCGLQRKTSPIVVRRKERREWEKASELLGRLQHTLARISLMRKSEGYSGTGEFAVSEQMKVALLGGEMPVSEPIELNRPARSMVPSVKTKRILQESSTAIGSATVSRMRRTPFNFGGRFMTLDDLNVLVEQIRARFDLRTIELTFRPNYRWTYTGRMEPRVPYMQQILWLWTHRFGGKLTVSVDSTRIRPRVHGPLVDYVAAVAGPVMKERAPRASGLQDVIDRQKEFYVWLSEDERRYGETGCWPYNAAAGRAKAMGES